MATPLTLAAWSKKKNKKKKQQQKNKTLVKPILLLAFIRQKTAGWVTYSMDPDQPCIVSGVGLHCLGLSQYLG